MHVILALRPGNATFSSKFWTVLSCCLFPAAFVILMHFNRDHLLDVIIFIQKPEDKTQDHDFRQGHWKTFLSVLYWDYR